LRRADLLRAFVAGCDRLSDDEIKNIHMIHPSCEQASYVRDGGKSMK
jgi:hypothetical protein